MIQRFLIVVGILILSMGYGESEYMFLATDFDTDKATMLEVNETGDITIVDDQIPVADGPEKVLTSYSGKYAIIGEFSPYITSFRLDKNYSITHFDRVKPIVS